MLAIFGALALSLGILRQQSFGTDPVTSGVLSGLSAMVVSAPFVYAWFAIYHSRGGRQALAIVVLTMILGITVLALWGILVK
jgi:hypothetical protein